MVGELLVRKYVPPPREHYYRFDDENKLFRRKPRLDGRFKKRNVNGYFLLNNEGWNSTRDYYKEKNSDTLRIACIGSSETGAYEVDVSQGYPRIIENQLQKQGIKNEVYTFAADRALNLTQMLHLTRYVIKHYSPNIIIFNGDPGEEFLFEKTTRPHYMSLKIDNSGNVKEILPRNDYLPLLGKRPTLKSIILGSQLVMYLRPKLALRTRFNKISKKAISKKNKIKSKSEKTNHTTRKVYSLEEKSEIGVNYLLGQFRNLMTENQVEFLCVIQAVRDNSFNWSDIKNEDHVIQVKKYLENRMATLDKFGFPYFQFTDEFSKDYEVNKKKFDFFLNPHKNEYGHRVEGETIANYLLKKYKLDSNLKYQVQSVQKQN